MIRHGRTQKTKAEKLKTEIGQGGAALKAGFSRHCGPGNCGLNAKAQGREGAKSSFLLCVFAPWRLCVEFLQPSKKERLNLRLIKVN
jgi:hypothetical protein